MNFINVKKSVAILCNSTLNAKGHCKACTCTCVCSTLYVLLYSVRENLRELSKEFDHSEDDLKALQSGVGQIVGEVLRQLTEDKCECLSPSYIYI